MADGIPPEGIGLSTTVRWVVKLSTRPALAFIHGQAGLSKTLFMMTMPSL
jgi:hypothetical protein